MVKIFILTKQQKQYSQRLYLGTGQSTDVTRTVWEQASLLMGRVQYGNRPVY